MFPVTKNSLLFNVALFFICVFNVHIVVELNPHRSFWHFGSTLQFESSFSCNPGSISWGEKVSRLVAGWEPIECERN